MFGGFGGTSIRELFIQFPWSGSGPGAIYWTPSPTPPPVHLPATFFFPAGATNSGNWWNWVTMVGTPSPGGWYAAISLPLPDITIWIRRSGHHYFFDVRMPWWMNGWSSGWLISPGCPAPGPGRKRRQADIPECSDAACLACLEKCIERLGDAKEDFPIDRETLENQCLLDCSADPTNWKLIGDFVEGMCEDTSGGKQEAEDAQRDNEANPEDFDDDGPRGNKPPKFRVHPNKDGERDEILTDG